MEKSISDIQVNILIFKGVSQTKFNAYHFLLVLNGNIRIMMGGQNYYLSENDIVLILPGEPATIWGGSQNRVVDLKLSVPFVQKAIPVYNGRFICNSAIDKQHDYSSLKKIIAKIAVISTNNDDISQLQLSALGQTLLYNLRVDHFEINFIVSGDEQKYQDRINELMAYIHASYKEDIGLDQLAQYMHLSASYLSRFFKKAFGDNFLSYLKKYRVKRAMDDLLYTDESVTKIALNHGFTNANGYIHAFKSIYDITPMKYRKDNVQINPATDGLAEEKVNIVDSLPKLISISEESTSVILEMDMKKQAHYVIQADVAVCKISPLWKIGINISSAINIFYYDILSEIKEIQNDIGFKYGRVTFLLSERFICKDQESGQYNFFIFTQMINNLRQSGMTPYLDLSPDPTKYMKMEDNEINVDILIDLIEQLILYSINIWGIGYVESWIYDIGHAEHFNTQKYESLNLFSHRYIKLHKLIKSLIPKAKVGGFNMMSSFMLDKIDVILTNILNENIFPDFISINIFPYNIISSSDTEKKQVYSKDNSYALNTVKKLKKYILKCTDRYNYKPEIYVNAIGTTIMHRNYMNDTCYQSTFIVKNTIDLIGEVDLLCYYQMSDYNFSNSENQALLNGRNGLISQFGIHKIGYLALEMMSRMPQNMIAKGECYLVTKDDYDNFYILLCNHSSVSDWYCLRIDENVEAKDAYTVYDSIESKNIFITLNHVNEGNYRIISHHLNRESGSLFDEWEKTGFWNNPNNTELNYLKKAMHPKRNCSQRLSMNGQLNFHINLMPFEVVLIEASRNVIVDNKIVPLRNEG